MRYLIRNTQLDQDSLLNKAINKKYYIAYGSNLNLAQMQRCCKHAKIVEKAMLNGYKLAFKGNEDGYAYLTIEPSDKKMDPIGIYEINLTDEKLLNRYEGYPNLYFKMFQLKSMVMNAKHWFM